MKVNNSEFEEGLRVPLQAYLDFEEQFGYSPDSDYEVIKTNDPDGKKWEEMKKEYLKSIGIVEEK